MRKVILSTNITLDGFMAGSNGELDWHFQNWNEEMEKYAYEQLSTMDTILVGRVTYQLMANYWPSAATNPAGTKRGIEFADMMNNYPKIVFSRTLEKVAWKNSRLVKENIAEEISNLKQQPGKDMIMWGGVGIVSTFTQLGLIDEYRIWVAPVVLGSGMSLCKGIKHRLDMKLLKTKTFSNGVVLLCYEPAKK